MYCFPHQNTLFFEMDKTKLFCKTCQKRNARSKDVGQQSSPTEVLPSSDVPEATLEVNEPSPDVLSEDANQCCVCFEMYEPDTEWVQCVCKRWLHEDCYTEVIVDKYGRELLCPFCVL